MKMKITLLCFTLVLSITSFCQTWNGSVSTDWNTAGNWTPSGVPTAASNVTIPTGSPRYPVLANNVTINSISMAAGSQLDANGFTVTIANTASNYNTFAGATLNNSSAITDIVLNINTGVSGYASYFRGMTVNDNITFNLTGGPSNPFYEADAGANTYVGNAIFNVNDALPVYISQGTASQFNSNLTVNRTVAGTTTLFNAGAVITGNFSYTNNTSGQSTLGNAGVATTIGGTVNIAASYTSANSFTIFRLINQITGGTINIQNSAGFDIQKDTLKVTSLSVTGYTGNAYATFYNNSITGNVTIADHVSYGGGYYTAVYNNVITGTSSFTNNGTNVFYEANAGSTANTYNGNTTFTGTNTGALNVSNGSASNFNGNLIVSRTAAGLTQFFGAGAVITGNFSYTNNTSGVSSLGATGVATTIGGTVNIAASYTSANTFTIFRLINQITGGTINIQNSAGFDIQKDTLKVTSLSVTGYTGNAYATFYNNSITGNVTIADDATYSGGYATFIRNNVITGNSSFTNNGTNILYDADGALNGNRYIGNVTYARNGSGTINVAAGSIDEITQNLTLNSASGITLGKIKFNGGTDGIVEQLGTQPISISELIMEKTGTGKITLNKPVTITSTTTFNSGLIITVTGKELNFGNGATATNASNASHVVGPVIKTGTDVFTFPVGKNNYYAPISITAPTIATDQFRAQYFNTNPHPLYDTSLRDPSLNHISGREYWLLDRITGASNVKVTLSYTTARSGIVNSMPDLRVARWNGSTWKDEGNGGTTGTNASGTVQSLNSVTNFSPFTLASATPLNPLPVQLITFTANKCNNKVCLQWVVVSEVNVADYNIERSKDGTTFEKITSHPALNLANTATYNSTDNSPLTGINYYRLKSIDKDGKLNYSLIVKVDFEKIYTLEIYPNPVHDKISVKTDIAVNKILMVTIADQSGRNIISNSFAATAGSVKTISTQKLPVGTYNVVVKDKEGKIYLSKQVVKQ